MFALFNRLFVKVYLTVAAALLLVVVLSALIWSSGPELRTARNAFEMASGVAAAALADPDASALEQDRAVKRLSRLLNADLALYGKDMKFIAGAGAPLPAPRQVDDWRDSFRSRGPVWSFRLADGRSIVVRPPFERHRHGPSFLLHIGLIALLLAILSWPVVRGLTRRLERLQQGVETLGAGDLTVRVRIEGSDEIGQLAGSFNRAAARIETLVNSHRMLLANASHELRTPLTRLRMGIELLKDKADPGRRAELEQDIAELDGLIDEILLSSRLDAMQSLEHVEEIDLLALAAEEAARFDDIAVEGQPLTLQGDSRLLRRVIRNLIENAQRHGRAPIAVHVGAEPGFVVLSVTDAGEGIPPEDLERVFEPFYRSRSGSHQDRGSGLGLAIVRQIAMRHGGSAAATRDVSGRSAFVVRFAGATAR